MLVPNLDSSTQVMPGFHQGQISICKFRLSQEIFWPWETPEKLRATIYILRVLWHHILSFACCELGSIELHHPRTETPQGLWSALEPISEDSPGKCRTYRSWNLESVLWPCGAASNSSFGWTIPYDGSYNSSGVSLGQELVRLVGTAINCLEDIPSLQDHGPSTWQSVTQQYQPRWIDS